MEYVKKMINFVKLNKNVYIHISEDHPMKMSYILSEDNPEKLFKYIFSTENRRLISKNPKIHFLK